MAVNVNEKRKETAILETVVNQCPVLSSQSNEMKLVLERPCSKTAQLQLCNFAQVASVPSVL